MRSVPSLAAVQPSLLRRHFSLAPPQLEATIARERNCRHQERRFDVPRQCRGSGVRSGNAAHAAGNTMSLALLCLLLLAASAVLAEGATREGCGKVRVGTAGAYPGSSDDR